MTKSIFSVLLWVLLISFTPYVNGQNEFQAIESLIDQYVEEYDIPAISVGIVKDGETTFINRGTWSRSSQRSVDEHSLYQIASVSKMFTGTIINGLLLEGKLDVNASIVDYLPADYPDKTKGKLRAITIRDVLHHRSGLPRDSRVTRNMRKGNDPLIYEYTEGDFRTDLHKMRLRSAPGEEYSYSNFGYALLGYIAERATDTPYEELLQTYVVDKFKLTTTTTVVDTNELITPYRKENRHVQTSAFILGKLTPPSGIFSSTYDLTTLMQQQLAVYANNEQGNALNLSADARPKTGIAYGYGIFDYDEGTYGHGGDIDGFASDYWFRPTAQIGCAMLTSSGGDWVHKLAVELNEKLTALVKETISEK